MYSLLAWRSPNNDHRRRYFLFITTGWINSKFYKKLKGFVSGWTLWVLSSFLIWSYCDRYLTIALCNTLSENPDISQNAINSSAHSCPAKKTKQIRKWEEKKPNVTMLLFSYWRRKQNGKHCTFDRTSCCVLHSSSTAQNSGTSGGEYHAETANPMSHLTADPTSHFTKDW